MADVFGEVVEKLRRSTVQVKAHRNGCGSGVIWSEDGRIVTNAHVVEGAGQGCIEVELWDGRSLRAASVYYRSLAAVKRVVNGFVPALHSWAEREQTLCAQFAAVLIDQRLARTAAAAADMRSY